MVTPADSTAELTLVSAKSGMHVSMRLVARANVNDKWVESAFDRASVIFAERPGKRGNARKVGRYRPRSGSWVWEGSANQAEQWTAMRMMDFVRTGEYPANLCEIMEAVPCRYCGETLFHPDSIRAGIGPVCGERENEGKAVPSGVAATA